MTEADGRRVVHCADAIPWMWERGVIAGACAVTSLPDVSEVGMSLEAWRPWFIDAARLVVEAVPDGSAAIFFQSDIKRDGVWIDKGALVMRAAQAFGARCVGVTLSQQQLELARERVARAGLSDRVEIRLEDYRDVTGQFDRITSVGRSAVSISKRSPSPVLVVSQLISLRMNAAYASGARSSSSSSS